MHRAKVLACHPNTMPTPGMARCQGDVADLETPLTPMIDPEIYLDANAKVPPPLFQMPRQLGLGKAAVGQKRHPARNRQ